MFFHREEKKLQSALVRCVGANEAESWLSLLARAKNCLIVAAVRDTSGLCYTQELDEQMHALGFRQSLMQGHWRGYIGIVDDGAAVYEELAEVNHSAFVEGTFSGVHLCVKSAPLLDGNLSEILIDGRNYSLNQRGVNLAVYDKALGRVVDTVCIDGHVPEHTLIRERIEASPLLFSASDWERIQDRRMLRAMARKVDRIEGRLCPETQAKPDPHRPPEEYLQRIREQLQLKKILRGGVRLPGLSASIFSGGERYTSTAVSRP